MARRLAGLERELVPVLKIGGLRFSVTPLSSGFLLAFDDADKFPARVDGGLCGFLDSRHDRTPVMFASRNSSRCVRRTRMARHTTSSLRRGIRPRSIKR